jgi:hypothetical protein
MRAHRKLARGAAASELGSLRIEFMGPKSFELPEVPPGVTVVRVGPLGEVKREAPPRPGVIRVAFRDARQLGMPSGLRRAEKAAAKAARTNRMAIVSIERAKGLSPETLTYVEAVGRSAGLKEISLRVGFDD